MNCVMSEIIVILWMLMICVQVSSLITSLILVPFSIVLMFSLNMGMSYSGFTFYIFIMIFIGGLMVLLVSVASTVIQEQGIFISVMMSSIIGGIFMLLSKGDWSMGGMSYENSFELIELLDLMKISMMIGILLVLVICLLIITKLLLDYKGLIRNL